VRVLVRVLVLVLVLGAANTATIDCIEQEYVHEDVHAHAS